MPPIRRRFTCTALLLLCFSNSGAAQPTYTLQELIEMGRRHNPTLAAMDAYASAQQTSWQADRRLPNPIVNLDRGSGTPADGSAARDIEGIGVRQVIENPVRRHLRIQAKRHQWEAATASREAVRLDLTYHITESYFHILQLQELVALFEAQQKALERSHEVTARMVELGEARQLDEMRLRVESLQARNQVLDLENRLADARRDLAIQLGDQLPARYRLADYEDTPDTDLDRDALLEAMRRGHPLLQEARHNLAAERSRLGEVRWARLPDPTLAGFWKQEMDGTVRGLGLTFEVPLWNLRSREIETLSHQVRRRELELEATETQRTGELLAHAGRVERAAETLGLFHDHLLQEADRSVEIADATYRHGEISLVEYLDARRGYIGVKIDYEDALYRWRMERAALERAVGGWDQ